MAKTIEYDDKNRLSSAIRARLIQAEDVVEKIDANLDTLRSIGVITYDEYYVQHEMLEKMITDLKDTARFVHKRTKEA